MKFSIYNFQFSKLLLIAILVLVFLFSASQTSAALVPCGGCEEFDLETKECINPQPPCQFCHIFTLIDNIVDFVLFKIVLPVAALMFIIGGFYLLIASGKPELFSQAKSILTAAVIGLVIIFVAFIFIGTFLQMIGLADWTTDIYKNWWEEGFFQFPCP